MSVSGDMCGTTLVTDVSANAVSGMVISEAASLILLYNNILGWQASPTSTSCVLLET